MSTTTQFPDSYYPIPPMNITPCAPTPNHTLYLTNIDDQMYTRAPANYVYLFKKSPGMDTLKSSLSRVLVDYYPFTGRFRTSSEDENKLVLDCNGEGVVFAEASMNITVEELLKTSMLPNKSWKNISCKVESKKGTHLPLAIQVKYCAIPFFFFREILCHFSCSLSFDFITLIRMTFIGPIVSDLVKFFDNCSFHF